MRGCTAAGDLNDAQYSRPLPWIGLYIAGASLLCGAAMAFDAYSGFRRRQLWFPSRLFSINATTLTLLGIATKLSVDLNTSMPSAADQLTKLSGTVLICTAMGNSLPSLGAMDDSDNLSNVVALGILAVTVVVNVAVQMGTGVIYVFLPEHAIIMLLMMVLLVLFASSALTVATTKHLLEMRYDSKYVQVSADADAGNGAGGNSFSLSKLKTCVKRFWLMAHTCSPQYVLGRSATCTASGAFCLLAAGVLAEALLRAFIRGSDLFFCRGTSDYEWSSTFVLIAQSIAVLVGTIAPACRWFNAVSIRSTEGRRWSSGDEFKVEVYWVQRLIEWKEAPLPFQLSSRRVRKAAHELKNSVMAVLVWLQAGVVLMSKLVRLASILPVSLTSKIRRVFGSLEGLSVNDENVRLRDYVLYLEGEEDLVYLIMRSERRDTDKWIEKGKRKQPTALLELINACSTMSEGFKGAYAFDSDGVSSLIIEQDPPHCWALPVVTLMSIVIALPGIDRSEVDSLRNGVSEGLRYVRLIEKFLDARGLANMREAADKIWMSVDLYDRWFDVDLHNVVTGNKSGKEVVEAMGNIAKSCVEDFLKKLGTDGTEANKNPLEWPGKVLAANCMYRVCATIRQDYDTKHWTDGNLLDWSRRTISDMLGACLTNLPRAILMECCCCRVEQREENVRDAAFLLGEAEKILEILENPDVTRSFPDEKQYIDAWRGREIGPWRLPSTFSHMIDL